MFKNLVIYRVNQSWSIDLAQANESLAGAVFVPCAATQEISFGWVPPRNEDHAPLVESVSGHWIMKLMIETRSVPGAAIKKAAEKDAADIEQTTGRKPGRKEMKSLKEDARMRLLPQAFPRQSSVLVWFDPAQRILVIDASSQSKTDEVITALIRAFDGLSLSLLNTNISPASAMSRWLVATDVADIPDGFGIGRETELKSNDEEKATVKFNRHHLMNEEVRRHIAEGKLPTRLAMDWEGRVSFVLSESMALRKIQFLEGFFTDEQKGEDIGFDADVAIATGEFSKLIPALIEALGGELDPKPAQ